MLVFRKILHTCIFSDPILKARFLDARFAQTINNHLSSA